MTWHMAILRRGGIDSGLVGKPIVMLSFLEVHVITVGSFLIWRIFYILWLPNFKKNLRIDIEF